MRADPDRVVAIHIGKVEKEGSDEDMTPYGYKIIDGKAELDDERTAQIRNLYMLYLDGWSIRKCSEETEIPLSIAGRVLSNRTYLGTSFYPAIIDENIFEKVQEERRRRNHRKPDRVDERLEPLPCCHCFHMNPAVYSRRPAIIDPVTWLYRNIEAGDETHLTEKEIQKLKELLW